MVSKKIRYCFLSGVIAIAAGVALANYYWSDSAVEPDSFPARTKTRVELRPGSADEHIRYVYMDDDGIKTLTQIEYRNGVTSYVFHRTDGMAKEIKDFYPAEEGETARQLKSQVSFEADGRSYLSHTAFRPDGSLERQGERMPTGEYQTTWFFDDGTSVRRQVSYDWQRKLLSADEYHKNGSLVSQSRRPNSNELITRWFSESGKLTHEFSEGKVNVLSGVFYNADGSVRVRFMDIGWKLNSQYFSKDELVLEVEYYKDFMEVTSYGADGKILQKQIWNRMGEKGEECTASYKLFKVEGSWHMHADKTYTRQIIEMSEDGTSVASVELVTVTTNMRNRQVKMLGSDGSVTFVKHYIEDILISERPGTDADRVDTKALIMKPQFECLPIPSRAERYRAHASFN